MKLLTSFTLQAATVAMAAVIPLVATAQSADREITVMAWGTTWEQALKTVATDFQKKTGIKVVQVTQSGSADGLARLQSMRHAPKIDIWFSTASLASRATADKQLFSSIPPSALSNASDLLKGSIADGWVAAYYYPLTIVYRPSLVKTPPVTWKDLWKPEYKSALAVPDVQTYAARMLLLSATVHGGGLDNVEPGFKAFKELRPNIGMFYGPDSDARRALAQGEVSMLVSPPNQVKPLQEAGIDVKIVAPKPAPVLHDVMTLVNTSKKDMALQFMNYVISPEAQTIITEQYNMAPVNRKVKPTAMLEPVLPKEEDQAVYDDQKINAQIGAWNNRFKSEIAK